jgi:hypothetical protein
MIRRPSNAISYQAAEILYVSGPQTSAQLLAAIYINPGSGSKVEKLVRAAASGWLVDIGGVFHLGDAARAHFDAIEMPTPAYVGQVAAPREPITPLDAVKPLSRKHIPDARGNRNDVPGYSVRDKATVRIAPMGSRQS